MADSALSLTKTAVEGTVGRVLAAIDEDKKLKAAAQQDLRFIVGEFQMMRSFLEEANDNKERTSKKVVKTWVRQLRELAFDVEDCVEFVLHLDTTSSRARWSWVWRLVPLPTCMAPAWTQHLDQAVAQLKQLKARVEEVSQRNTRYNLLGGDDSGSSTTLLPAPPEDLDAAAFPSTVDILRDLWKANGKESSSLKCNLKYLVADGRCSELRVISVWRTTGVDLEAEQILNATYLDPEICKEFKARARVKLMHPFNIEEFLKSMLNQLYVTLDTDQQDTLGEDLLHSKGDNVIQHKLRQLLSKHKYLVILEDLSSALEWDLISLCLPDCHKGSRIVISTQQVEIALLCTGEPYRVLQLALLPNNDRYIYAFYKPSDVGITELVRQLGRRRVISLWGGDKGDDTASLVKDVYKAMKDKTAAFKGVKFEKYCWVNVPSPCSLEKLYLCMPDWEYAYDEKIYFDEFWRDQVCVHHRYLCVIEGLQSKQDWDLIRDALVPEDTKSCIVIIAKEEAVAKYCEEAVPDDKEANKAAIVGALFAQKDQYYSWGQNDRYGSHGCSSRMEVAFSDFAQFITPDQQKILDQWTVYWEKERYGVHAVWGATGVGKSALVRFFYYKAMAISLKMNDATDELISQGYMDSDDVDDLNPFKMFGWVDVPNEPFDLAEFSRRLLLDFNSYDPWEMEKTAVGAIQGHNPIQRCYEIVRRHKCLVVIDGLRSTRDWDSIKQAIWWHHHQESCIFVITTDESIAKHCNSIGRTTSIRALDDQSALDLYKKIVADQNAKWDKRPKGRGHDQEWSSEQNLKHANRIVPKCGGLPKIIDAVARSPCSFGNIDDDLVTKLKNDPKFNHLRGVLSWMHSYIDGRSDSVKPCIFYLSVFPINYKIRKAHLLRRWIAEGYCRDTTGYSAKEDAESLYNQLSYRDIIQHTPIGSMWHVNGFFREYIISQPMEDNLVLALEGQCKANSQRTVQHLTIMEDWKREKHVFESIDASRLRSLTVYGEWKPFFVSDKMKRIRVLDLEGTSGVQDCCLEHIFEILLSLKYICLRGCKSVTCLPTTLGGLRQLESLDVCGTSIVTLPRAIIKLHKIQYIRAGCNILPDEDSDDAVGSQQPSGATDKQVDGAMPVGCRWTSTESSQDSNDVVVGSQQLSGRTPAPEAEGSDGHVVATSSPLPLISQDNKQVDGARQNKLLGCCWTSNKSSRDSDDAVRSQQPSGTARPGPGAGGGQTGQPLQAPKTKEGQASRIPGPAATPEAQGSDGGHQGHHQHHEQQYHKIRKVGRRCTSRLSSRLSPLLPCSWFPQNNPSINDGVEVPIGIEDMPALHTIGTVNIKSAGGKHFLAKLMGKTKLPQLLNLRVSDVNKENWKDLCDALSAHHHLESLSVVLDEDFTGDICFDNPHKALK